MSSTVTVTGAVTGAATGAVAGRTGAGFRLSDFLDRFIPAELQASAETHRRARMFMLSHVFGPILGNSLPLYLVVMDVARDYRSAVFFFSILLFWAYPPILKWTGRYQLLAFLSVQNLIFCVLWACFAFGGALSPFLPWLLLFPLLAFLYLPPVGWVRNLLLVQIFGSSLAFLAATYLGVPMPQVALADLEVIGMISMASVGIYFAMMSLYFAKMFREQGQFTRELNSLVSTSDNLRNLTDAANQASRAKADFVAGMSHELRTPLNGIIGYSQLLLEEAEDEDDEETIADVGHINQAGTSLLALIDDILTFSRIEAGKMPLNPSVRTAASQVKLWLDGPRLADIRARIAVAPTDEQALQPMLTDWTMAETVVQHMLAGAAHQHPAATIAVSLAGSGSEGLRVALTARDGEGRPVAIAAHSEIFEDGEDASGSKYGRTGIEFPLAIKLADLLGGRIARAGGGTLAFTLPPLAPADRLAA